MASFRPTFHKSLVSDFVSNVYYGRKTLHYFLGKVDEWESYVEDVNIDQCDCTCIACESQQGTTITVQYNDTNPPRDPDNAYINEANIRNNILYVRKVAPDDISVVIPNHVWKVTTVTEQVLNPETQEYETKTTTTGNVYAQWDHTKDMTKSAQPFYVMNSEFNVYKCLSNNNGAQSLYEPKGINYDVVITDDGYIWKYMYSIPLIKQQKFVSTKYIPVQRAVDENFYTHGSIEGITVVIEGNGYSSDPKTTAIVEPPKEQPGVETRQAKISLLVNYETGSIDDVYIVDRGCGYTTTPSIQISPVNGTSKYAEYTDGAKLQAHILNGELDSVSILDPGVGYLADIETTLTVVGDGEGCVAYPMVVDGKIKDVIVTNAGFGYTHATVVANCSKDVANIEKAVLKAMIGGSKLDSDQSIVEQTTTPGAIYSIVVTNSGRYYNSLTTKVRIEGDGQGCTAHVVFNRDFADRIERIVVDNYGEGYTWANVVIEDENRIDYSAENKASAYAILPPHYGHGHDAVEELYGKTVCIHSSVQDDVLLSSLGQDIRQYGLVSQLRRVDDNTLVKDSESLIMFEVKVEQSETKSSTLEKDDLVTINNVRYCVLSHEGTTFKLQQLSDIYRQINPGDAIRYVDDETNMVSSFVIENVISQPHIDKYSGELLYINNKAPFTVEVGRSFGMKTYFTL